MKPTIAVCNLFDQDAERLAEFACHNGFEGIEWSIDQGQSEKEFISRMDKLKELEVRFHCPFQGVDIAYADERAMQSKDLIMKWVERVAMAGRKHMTVHVGFGLRSDRELSFARAVENLTALVRQGAEYGVSISLENLTTVWTGVPALFNELVQRSGVGVCFDIGHAHVCEHQQKKGNTYEQYILPNRHKILSAHIYHTEVEGVGHLAPESLHDIYDRLEMLKIAELCNWWVIELKKYEEVLRTRDFLANYLESPSRTSSQSSSFLKKMRDAGFMMQDEKA
jgi:sugar phosphate isomerase/epimerase